MVKLGQGLQIIGMSLLPVAMVGEILDRSMGPKQMLLIAALGVLTFIIGRMIAQAGQSR